jgi:hypothetical protein
VQHGGLCVEEYSLKESNVGLASWFTRQELWQRV